MAIAAGQKVTAASLNRLQPKQYHAAGTASTAVPASSTNADVPGCSVTFSTEKANAKYTAVLVINPNLSGATTTVMTGRIKVDGVVTGANAAYAAEVSTDEATVAQTYSGTLAATGSHTITAVVTTPANLVVWAPNCTLLVTITEDA